MAAAAEKVAIRASNCTEERGRKITEPLAVAKRLVPDLCPHAHSRACTELLGCGIAKWRHQAAGRLSYRMRVP